MGIGEGMQYSAVFVSFNLIFQILFQRCALLFFPNLSHFNDNLKLST